MKFDRDNLIGVAAAVVAFNKYAKDRTIAQVIAQMESVAFSEFHANKGSFVATGGFMLTRFVDSTGAVCVRASVTESILRDATAGAVELDSWFAKNRVGLI